MKKSFSFTRALITFMITFINCFVIAAVYADCHACTIVQNPIIGRAKKQSGGMVFYTLLGQNIMRSRPNNYKEPVGGNYINRINRFSAAMSLGSQLKSFATLLINPHLTGKNSFSSLMSFILKAWDYSMATPVWSPAMKQCSKGAMPWTPSISITRPSANAVTVTWDPTIVVPNQLSSDIPSFLVTDRDGIYAQMHTPSAIRSAGTGTFSLPEFMAGFDIFVSDPIFHSTDGKLTSDSYFAQTNDSIHPFA